MSILSTILGSGDVISKGLGLIDSMHTSDTEMIEAKTKAKTDLLSAYSPFKVAQRYLALRINYFIQNRLDHVDNCWLLFWRRRI